MDFQERRIPMAIMATIMDIITVITTITILIMFMEITVVSRRKYKI